MDYFTLQYNMEEYKKNGVIIHHDGLYEQDRYSVERGQLIKQWNEKTSFYFNENEGNIITDYMWNDFGWPIVSEKFKKVLENINIEGIQYLPINIENKSNGVLLEKYYVANIYNLVKAIDMEKSEYFQSNSGINYFVSHVIKEKNLNALDIFRLKEDNIPIFLSERIKIAIKRNKITGCDFTKVEVS